MLMQLLHRNQEELLTFAIENSPSGCLILLPQESQMKGFPIDQVGNGFGLRGAPSLQDSTGR